MEHQIEIVPADALRRHPKNPNRGDVEAIRESIRAHGFFGALVAQRSTGFILAGNHRYLVGREEGVEHFPVYWVDVDDEQAARILLADNRIADLHETDDTALRELLRDLDLDTVGAVGTGYELDELLAIMDESRPPAIVSQQPTTPTTVQGPPTERCDSLHPHPDNPRQGNVDAIVASIKAHGFLGAITAQVSTRYVLIGNHRLEALRRLGITHVPVIWVDCDDEQALQIMLADNRVSDRAIYDQAALTTAIDKSEKVESTGWTERERDLLRPLEEWKSAPVPTDASAGEEPVKPRAADVAPVARCPHCGGEL